MIASLLLDTIVACGQLLQESAAYILMGLFVAGLIRVYLNPATVARHLGSGLPAMLIMAAAGIPLYVCATASTPIAAALILKGVIQERKELMSNGTCWAVPFFLRRCSPGPWA